MKQNQIWFHRLGLFGLCFDLVFLSYLRWILAANSDLTLNFGVGSEVYFLLAIVYLLLFSLRMEGVNPALYLVIFFVFECFIRCRALAGSIQYFSIDSSYLFDINQVRQTGVYLFIILLMLVLLYFLLRNNNQKQISNQLTKEDFIKNDAPTKVFPHNHEFSITLEKVISPFGPLIQSLHLTSENQSDIADEVTNALDEIDASIQNITSSIEEQKIQTQNSSLLMEAMEESFIRLKETIQITSNTILLVKDTLMSGKNELLHTQLFMNEIRSSSTKISQIVSVIKDMADKTSLLSLNASIEAARAGDAGTGFSVVANEVGKLAIKSKEQTKDIHQSVKLSLRKVEEGFASVEKVIRIFDQVVEKFSHFERVWKEEEVSLITFENRKSKIAESITELNEHASMIHFAANEQEATISAAHSSFIRNSKVKEELFSFLETLILIETSLKALNLSELYKE